MSPGGSTLQAPLHASGHRGRAAGEVLAWGEGVGIALGSPFGGSMRSSPTYAANLGAAR